MRKIILVAGFFNLLGAIFHVWLCFQIFKFYGGQAHYPLMQMLSICGTILIAFLAFTSLFCAAEIAGTKIGRWVLALNIAIYGARTVGEVLLFPQPSFFIIGVCILFVALYVWIWAKARGEEKTA
jgi:hypothetical protein